jgi:hypothetical protein
LAACWEWNRRTKTYGKNQTIKFVKIADKEVSRKIIQNNILKLNEKNNNGLILQYKGENAVTNGYYVNNVATDDVYEIVVYTSHDLNYVPAFRVGVKSDLYTNAKTFVSPLDKAVPILMKIVKANSEFDLTMALHAFPQKLSYAPRCKEKDCRDGTLIDGTVCGRCHGSGWETITSAQESITLSLPKDKEDMISLENIIRYVDFPVDLATLQEEHIFKILINYVKEAVFNTELFSKKEVSETASGKNISLQNIYDSLYPVAEDFAKQWKFVVTSIAEICELDTNLLAAYHFSKDFKLKSLSDLYIDLKMVGDASASEFVKSSIESDIANIIYSEDEQALIKYNVKQSFFPFSGKGKDEIKIILASPDLVNRFTKVFYANYGTIFDEIEIELSKEKKYFYYMPRDKQWELIVQKVNEYITKIDEEKPKTPSLDFNTQ